MGVSMQPTLTAKQQRVLDYLRHEITTSGQAPSLRQAAADLGVSHAAIAQILKVLEKKGSINLSFTACRDMLPDPAFYADCLQQSFDELRTATLQRAKPAKTKPARKKRVTR